MKILVTGPAGFIGMQVAKLLLERGDSVVGLDNINDYYDPALKKARLDILAKYPGFRFVKLDVAARAEVAKLFAEKKFLEGHPVELEQSALRLRVQSADRRRSRVINFQRAADPETAAVLWAELEASFLRASAFARAV